MVPVGDLPHVIGGGRLRLRTALALRRARHLAEVEPGEFALAMTTVLADANGDAVDACNEPVTGAMVMGWEDGLHVPPATVLLAAAEVAGIEVEFLFHRRPVVARLLHLEDQFRRQSKELSILRRRLELRSASGMATLQSAAAQRPEPA